MISYKRTGWRTDVIVGLSTETKPTDVDNGYRFCEIDTGYMFAFDAEHSQWHKLPGSSVDEDEVRAIIDDATAELQAELDEAISGATEDSEVINARVGADATTYSTLKQRLDAEHTDLKNQMNQKADAIINSASGAIASFNDGVDDVPVRDLVVNIEPVQSGSGDPSPDNIRPISGWTGMSVQKAGKNLLGLTLYNGFSYNEAVGSKVTITEASESLVDNQDGTFTLSNATAWEGGALMFYMKANVQYHLHVALEGAGQRLTFGKVSLDGTILSKNNSTESSYTINANQINAEDCYCYLYMVSNQSNYSITITEPQAEFGSTATAYEPYSGQTYPITFSPVVSTVYGGSLDVTNGVLTIEWVSSSPEFGPSWTKTGSSSWWRTYSDKKRNANSAMCSHFTVKTYTSSDRIQLNDTGFTTIEELANYQAEQTANGTPIQIARLFATPRTYQLTPTEVKTLLKQNNIFADTGDIASVEYVADTKSYIDNKFAELQALILENA